MHYFFSRSNLSTVKVSFKSECVTSGMCLIGVVPKPIFIDSGKEIILLDKPRYVFGTCDCRDSLRKHDISIIHRALVDTDELKKLHFPYRLVFILW